MNNLLIIGILLNCLGKLRGCVYITVSSLPSNKLEINWNCEKNIQSITVYDKDPRVNTGLQALGEVSVENRPKGYVKTNVNFNPEPFPGGWSLYDTSTKNASFDLCLYWIEINFSEQSPEVDCFRIHPIWMSKNKEKLKNLSLPLMFIPGTHNSGTVAMKAKSKSPLSHLDNFVLTQDQSIWNQLVYGIRFFDLRVGYYPQEKDNFRFWINHDLLRIQPLLPVLKNISHYFQIATDEIVILDFHRFPAGFKSKNAPAIHRELIDVIGKEIKHLAIPRPLSQMKLKLEDIWNTDKRIIVSYSEDNIVWETPWLWTSVSQRWGNKQSPQALEKFLDNTFRDVAPRKLWAAMSELTPTPLDFLGNKSLRSMADSVNRLLTNCFLEKKNWTSRANIVAPDFFLGTDLVNIAIDENLRRAKELA